MSLMQVMGLSSLEKDASLEVAEGFWLSSRAGREHFSWGQGYGFERCQSPNPRRKMKKKGNGSGNETLRATRSPNRRRNPSLKQKVSVQVSP